MAPGELWDKTWRREAQINEPAIGSAFSLSLWKMPILKANTDRMKTKRHFQQISATMVANSEII